MGRRNKLKKEEIAEDWCFICKDGGSLRICDYRDCLKSYHPDCLGQDDSLLESKDQWACDHSPFQVKHFANGAPKESDMVVKTCSISLKVEPGSNAVVIKNLYLVL
ncbi:zinc finger CCCH domain-containing protein 44-like [Pistacia vera]|uniref:zinc finger CCCH domain-containing protein 44-like n=1 Tax=Pistacia vera TaxID=55513 RepID=UPI0012638492|nr:zinc finger CCCH domain-containing protein 44-like [Pistacia vera]XP_031258481.1 zinc finger CCCH domain-containing protein 44-like [Pistacia vera]